MGSTPLLFWFDKYELLGDDIVLFDREVAEQYLLIMKDIGLEINQSKSVISKVNAFEFAKVTGLNGSDVSALSWKMFISQPTMMGRVNIVHALLRRRIIFKHPRKYIVNILKKSRSDFGDINYNLFAL